MLTDSRTYGVCPKCSTKCWIDASDGKEPNIIGYKDRRETQTDYGPGEDWIEVWKCPTCKEVFEERNGYP